MRALRLVLVAATLTFALAGLAAIASQTTWARGLLRKAAVTRAGNYLDGTIAIDRVGGNLFAGVELDGLVVTAEGETIISVPRVVVRYDVGSLLSDPLTIASIRLDKPVIRVRRDERGWNILRLLKDRGRKVSGRRFAIGSIAITGGSVEIEKALPPAGAFEPPARLNDVHLEAAIAWGRSGTSLRIGRLDFASESPALRVEALTGTIAAAAGRLVFDGLSAQTARSLVAVDGHVDTYQSSADFDIRCEASPLSIDEVGRFVNTLASTGLEPALVLSARGPASGLAVGIELKSNAGNVNAQATADVGRRFAKGTASLERVNLAPLVRDAGKQTDITGEAAFDLRWAPGAGPLPIAGTVTLTDGRAQVLGYEASGLKASASLRPSSVDVRGSAVAYGASATAAGVVRFGSLAGRNRYEYELRGKVAGANLERLPASLSLPAARSRLDFEYNLAGSPSSVSGDAVLGPSDFAGATIAAGTTVSFAISPGSLWYEASGEFGNLDVAAVGRELGIAAIDSPRFRTVASGPFELSGTGRDSRTARISARGTLLDSTVFEASIPSLDYEVRLAGQALAATARGSFRRLDPGALSRSPALEGTLGGSLDLRLEVPDVRAESGFFDTILADGRVLLGPSSFRGLAIDSAEVRGRYAAGRAEIARLAVTGPAVDFDAAGPVSFGNTGDSNLRFRFASTDLAAAGRSAGLALGGAATFEGVLKGNGSMMTASGKAKAAGLRYGEGVAAEAASAPFEAALPELDLSRLRLRTEASAAGVSLAGQVIDSVTAKLDYADRAFGFETVLSQRQRRADVAGRAFFDEGRQRLEIDRAEVTLGIAGGDTWSLVAGGGARVGFGGDRIVLEGIRFRSGTQEVAVDGILDPVASHIRAEADAVDLGPLSPLFMPGRRVEGLFTGAGSASGPRDALVMAGEFSASAGAFDGVGFERARGRAGYGHGMVSLDVRVDQSVDSWLEARGSVPARLFVSSEPAGVPETRTGGGLDLTVKTGKVPLGMLEGLSPHLREIGGTVQVDARFTGSLDRPAFRGFVDVMGGRFNVVPAGVTYSNMNGRLRLEGDRIRVDGLRVVDERGRPLSLSGQLGVRGRTVGSVDLAIDAADFTVSNNDLALLRLAALMRVSGDVRRPVVTGVVEVDDGTIQVDRVLEALSATDLGISEETQPVARSTTRAGERPPVLDAATVDVTVKVPNNLVVRGTDVGSGRSLVGFGDVNVTFGGDVKLQKLPFERPALLGEVRTVRGTYDFQGRRFDIVRGSGLRFHGLSPIDPSLDVTASRTISGVETLVHVRGTLRQPELQLSSVPQLDEADVLSLIVFNQPANQLGAGQQISLAERAGVMAGGFITSRLAESINRALRFDVLEIQAQPERGSGVGATITVGEQVGDRLYLRLRQVIGEDNVTQFALEYQLADFARLETSVTQGQSLSRSLLERLERGGLDLIFFFSY